MKDLKVPELRFPEFGDEWRTKKLGSICTKVGSGKTPKGGEKVYSNEGIPFIRSQNVIDNQLRTDSTFIPLKVHREMKGSKVVSNDILLNITGGSIGRSCVVPTEFKEGNVNQHVCIIRLKNDNPYFLQPILSSWRGQKLIYQGQTGSGREGLNFESIKVFRIGFPSLPEQTKIANFLTTVDKRINLLTQQKEKLERYKKGVMQQIFSQQLRFKDEYGNAFPEWELVKLKYVLFEHKKKNGDDAITEVFSVAKESGVVNQIEHLGRSYAAESISHYKLLDPYDIVYTKSPTSSFPFGIIKQNKTNRTGVVSPLYAVFKPKTPALGSILHGYFLSWINTYNYLVPLVQKGAKNTMNINNNDFLNGRRILLPLAEPEQQKIATFLSSIDKKIELVNQQIEQNKTWKKGLLQKMFV